MLVGISCEVLGWVIDSMIAMYLEPSGISGRVSVYIPYVSLVGLQAITPS